MSEDDLKFKRIRRRHYLVVEREDCCAEASSVAPKHHMSRGRTGEFRWWWWWWQTVPRDPRRSVKRRLFQASVWLVYEWQPSRNFSVILITKICFIRVTTVETYHWMPIIWSRWKTSEIISSSRTWPNNCIPKIVSGCLTPNWMRHNDTTATVYYTILMSN